jgi:hypothetical protein
VVQGYLLPELLRNGARPDVQDDENGQATAEQTGRYGAHRG